MSDEQNTQQPDSHLEQQQQDQQNNNNQLSTDQIQAQQMMEAQKMAVNYASKQTDFHLGSSYKDVPTPGSSMPGEGTASHPANLPAVVNTQSLDDMGEDTTNHHHHNNIQGGNGDLDSINQSADFNSPENQHAFGQNNQNQYMNHDFNQYSSDGKGQKGEVQQESVSVMPTIEDFDVYRIVFELFDRDNSGFIEAQDLTAISAKVGLSPEEVLAELPGMDRNNDGRISFGEFVQALWPFHAQDKAEEQHSDPIPIQASFMSTTQRTHSEGGNVAHNDSILEGTAQPPKLSVFEKRTKMALEFGAMIPDKQVTAQPDVKVLRFLRLFQDYQNQCNRERNYLEAKRSTEKFNLLSNYEFTRQVQKMENIQKEELRQVEVIQRQQFQEFTDAWDQYMTEYEQNAYQSVERLKQDQAMELQNFRQNYMTDPKLKFQPSKRLLDLKVFEQKAFKAKEFDLAENHSYEATVTEQREREYHMHKCLTGMEQKETKFVQKLQAFMQTLLKRIQRDRDEQLQHRKSDSQILIQRNKNVLQDVIKRHALQSKRTVQFLKHALGNRSREVGQLSRSVMMECSGERAFGDVSNALPSIFGPSVEGSIHTARKGGASQAYDAYRSVEARTSVKSEIPTNKWNNDVLKSGSKLQAAGKNAVILPHLMKKKHHQVDQFNAPVEDRYMQNTSDALANHHDVAMRNHFGNSKGFTKEIKIAGKNDSINSSIVGSMAENGGNKMDSQASQDKDLTEYLALSQIPAKHEVSGIVKVNSNNNMGIVTQKA